LPNRRTSTAIGAAIAFCATIATLAPGLSADPSTGDTAEAQTVPYILGIAHATGFPAYTLLGWLFSHVLPFGTVAWRLNLFTALCVAVTAAGVVLLADAIAANAFAALAAALIFAFGNIVRSEGHFANALSLAGLCGVYALAAAVWYARSGDRRALLAACAWAGLGLATHPSIVFVLPAIVVAGLWRWRALSPRTAAVAAVALAAPLLLYLYFPVRSSVVAAQHLDPAARAPVFGTGRIDWDTNSPRTLNGFLDEVLARHEKAATAFKHFGDSRLPLGATRLWIGFANRQFGTLVEVLVAFGAVALARRDLRALSVVAAGTIGFVLFAGIYHLDTSIYWYYSVPVAATAALAAAATRLELPRVRPGLVQIVASVLLVVAAGLTWADARPSAGIPVPPDGQPIIDAVARDVPACAIIVAPWYEALALGYGAAIEHALGSRIIVAGLPAQFVRYFPAWSRARPVVVYAGGMELMSVGRIPPMWIAELPSSNMFYHVFEMRPRTGDDPIPAAVPSGPCE